MSVYLVRPARAGSRQRWKGDDRDRPLSKVGLAQAEAIARHLARKPIGTIVSSPYARCLGTVEPIARKRKIDIEMNDALAEGAQVSQALRLFEKVQDREAVLCTHGDVIEHVLSHLRDQGIDVAPFRFSKGSTWVLDTKRGEIVSARYLPRPR